MKTRICLLLGLGIGLSPAQAEITLGQTIGIDFGTIAPAAGQNFNAYTDVVIANGASESFPGTLIDTTGASVPGVGFSVLNATGQATGRATGNTGGEGFGLMTNSTIYSDWLISNSASGYALDSGGHFVFTFTGLNNNLAYDLVGGFDGNNNNFDAIWSAGGQSFTTVPAGSVGYGTLSGLLTDGSGNLTIKVAKNTLHVTAAGLTLTAVEPPAPLPPPPAPALPPGVTVIFDPTAADTSATVDDLNAVTVGGRWNASFSGASRFNSNIGGFLYLLDAASAQGSYVELVLDNGGLDFSSTDVAINFEMLAARASASADDKHTTLIGYDGTNEIFRLKYISRSVNTLNTVAATTGDGDASMGFVPLRWITESSGSPSGLQDFRIVLSGTEVSFSGSSLASQNGPVLNSAHTLTSLRWEITGTATDNQGFWLDDLQIRNGLPVAPRAATDRPNIIFILQDDMGYSDVSCYGGTKAGTPNIDAMASNGLQFSKLLLPANVCSPSRAAFLTGAYPSRCGIPMAVNHPNENHWFLGLDPDEITLAEQCRNRGYKTCMVGKWHLGTQDVFLPHNQGFDHWLGTWGNGGEVWDEREIVYSAFPETILTSLYTQRVREHIRTYRDRPFFIYYAHNYPHDPYTEGNAFDGSTGNGTRADVLREVDWGIGQIVAELEAQGLLENTLIVFSSDNGAVPPVASYANVPFRGSKYVTWEGGHRVPFIIYWKGQVQTPAVLDTQVWSMDLFPTLSELIGEPLPTDRVYDGTSLVPLLTDRPVDRAADAPFYYYTGDNLQCVRVGDWKLHVPRTEYQLPWWDQIQPPASTYQLYDLANDVHEDTNVAAEHPDIVAALSNLAVNIRLDLGDADPTNGSLVMGSGQRGTGTIYPEVPTILNLDSDYAYVPDWNSLTAAEKGRGATRFGMNGVVNAAHEYVGASAFPFGWQYLAASAPAGGIEVALTPNTVVGTQANTGFSGSGSVALIGNASTGTFVIDSANAANGGVAGTDLLVVPEDYVIVRYTIDENDVSFGKTRASISGSFRDLVGGTSDDSITVQVFHNDTELFAATGAAGRLLQAAGTFNLTNVLVAAGDAISFVVGSKGDNTGDEAALRASIQFSVSADVADHVAMIEPGMVFAGGTATLRFSGTPGQAYRIEQTSDLAVTNGWSVVDEYPFLPASPFPTYLDATSDQGFLRVVLKQ